MKSFKRQIYKLSQFEENKKQAPTVDDNGVEFNGTIFSFNESHFTNNFQDADGDSYKFVRITSLPTIGTLLYNDTPVQQGFTFNISNVGNLKFNLPDSYLFSSEKICSFNNSISTLISQQGTEGFELTYKDVDSLEFEKVNLSSIPNDTDIYIFLDVSEITLTQASEIRKFIDTWFSNYLENNQDFKGNYFVLPTNQENWLDYPTIIKRGSSNNINERFGAIAKIPANFDSSSEEENSNWISPSNVTTIALIGKETKSSTIYHSDRTDLGLRNQPTSQYVEDYKNFVGVHDSFNFFKGIFYPLVNIKFNNYNNIGNAKVLQGFSAIEGKSTYTRKELKEAGVSNIEDRKYHWYLDPSHQYYQNSHKTIANPYSEERDTYVDGILVKGLKDYGWRGVYNRDIKDTSLETISSDFNKFLLEGNIDYIAENTIKPVKCVVKDLKDLCFNFKTSDDSDYLLFSNEASFCFTLDTDENLRALPPTVSSFNEEISSSVYQFKLLDFISNFYDGNNDSYFKTRIITPFVTSQNVPIGEIRFNGIDVEYPFEFELNNIGNLEFVNNNNYTLGSRIYSFDDALPTLISTKETEGFVLMDYMNGEYVFYKYNALDPQDSTIETIKGKDIGSNKICTNFKTSDDSEDVLYSSTKDFCLFNEDSNTPPIIEGGSDVIIENVYNFNLNNISGIENIKSVTILGFESTTEGRYEFRGEDIEAPFSFNVEDANDFKFILNEKYHISGDKMYVFDKTIAEIEAMYPDYTITSNEGGVITLTHNQDPIRKTYVYGKEALTEEKCITFKVSVNDDVPLFSNEVNLCLSIPTGETLTVHNKAPMVGNGYVTINVEDEYTFKRSDFVEDTNPAYQDPEGDQPYQLKVVTLPSTGTLVFNGSTVNANDIILFTDIEQGLFKYVPDSSNLETKEVNFEFQINDTGSKQFVG